METQIFPYANIIVGVLHYKPWSILKPEHFIKETKLWVVYPWEVNEKIKDLFKKLEFYGLSKIEIKNKMITMGFQEVEIEKY